MGTKRAHADFDSEGAQPHDQRSNSPGSEDGQHDNKRFKATKRRHRAKEGTTNWNKTRARTIRRLLQSGKELPATKRNELEQELQALQERVEEHDFRKRRSNMIQKYHMVRFFGTWKFHFAPVGRASLHSTRLTDGDHQSGKRQRGS